MQPLVSIIIPVYNAERFLRETLDSLVEQTYKHFEVICVDDGSTDKSLEILREYNQKDSRFRFIEQNNQYAGVARNNGLKVACGKYIMFLDSDDLFEKKMLFTLVKIAERKKIDILFFGFYHFKTNKSKRSSMGIPYKNKHVCTPEEHAKDIFKISQGVPWNKFYNREFVLNTGLKFQDLQSNNDVFFSKAIVIRAKRLLYLNKRFVNYRVNNNESIQGSYKLCSGNFAKCILAIFDELNKEQKYELYKESFENYVIESYMLIFNKCKNLEDFYTVCDIMRSSLDKMNINVQSLEISLHPQKTIFQMIMLKNYENALFELKRYMEKQYIFKGSIEYRIGKNLLEKFRIKSYD